MKLSMTYLKLYFCDNVQIDSICQLINLAIIDIHGCYLEKLPKQFSNLINLTEIDIHGCYLKQLPKEFSNLINLKKADLRFNDFSDISPIAAKVNLWDLDISFLR